ncbi:unnamed protein product, partial [marine sediment metagenome]
NKMKYTIKKAYVRKYFTASDVPVTVTVVKFETESGYKGTVEMPSNFVSPEWIRKAVLKNIENAKLICPGTGVKKS